MKTRLVIEIMDQVPLRLVRESDLIKKREELMTAIVYDMRKGRNRGCLNIDRAIVDWSIWKQTEG